VQTIAEAINHGAIHRLIPKPWNASELKVTLHLALEQLRLERENRRVLAMARCLPAPIRTEKGRSASRLIGLEA